MKIPFPFVENSAGQPDGMWSLTILSFIVVVVAIFWTGDATQALTLYGATTAAYFGRKHTDKNAKHPTPPRAPAAAPTVEAPRPGEELAG